MNTDTNNKQNSTETPKRGRPVGTGNHLVSLAELAKLSKADIPKDVLEKLERVDVPVIKSFVDATNLRSKGAFATSKANLSKLTSKYVASTTSAVKEVNLAESND